MIYCWVQKSVKRKYQENCQQTYWSGEGVRIGVRIRVRVRVRVGVRVRVRVRVRVGVVG